MKYQPKKSTQRWLKGAPDYILAVYDKPKTVDRYTILFGKPFWHEEMGRNVLYLGMSEGGRSVSMFGEMPSGNRQCLGKKIKWSDLSKDSQNHIIARMRD